MPLTMPARALCLLLMLATPGHAQLTPEALWQGWQAVARESGQSLDAAADRAGDTLILRDLRGRAERQGTLAESRLAWVRLTARPDGSVHVAMAPEVAVTTRFTDAGGQDGRIEMRLVQEAAEIVARGAPDAIEQVFTATRVAITEFAFTLDGARQDVELTAEARDLRSVQTTAPGGAGGGLSGQGAGRAGWLAFDLSAAARAPREDSLRLAARIEAADWSFTVDGPADAAQPALEFDLRHGALFAMADLRSGVPREAARGEIRAAGGTLALTQRPDGTMQLAVGARAARASVIAPRLPLETVGFTAEEAEFVTRLPTAAQDAGAMPFGLDLALRGLLPGTDLHRLLDPSGAYPLRPGALAFEISGRMRAGAAGAAQAPAPGRIESLRLRNLLVDFEGARLSGRGDLAFSAPPAAPPAAGVRPEGKVELELDGGDALLQKLGQAGLIAENQVMGLRMMLAMFTVPGTTPDSMRAEIEFTPEGRVLANGQPLN